MYPKRLTIQLFIILIFSFSISLAGLRPEEYMPDSIKAINNPADLQPYLENPDSPNRWWAVERMGQIGSSENIPQLMEIFENTPFDPVIITADRGSDIKDRVILSIGEIGGPEAEAALFGILDKLDIHNIRALDSLDIITYSCHAFAEMSSFNALNWLNSIYADTLLKFGYRIGALKAIYLIELTRPEYSSAKDTVEYLLDKIANNYSSSIKQLEDFIITEAAAYTLCEISSPAIYQELSLQSENLSEDIRQNRHFKYLMSTVKAHSDSPHKRNWRW